MSLIPVLFAMLLTPLVCSEPVTLYDRKVAEEKLSTVLLLLKAGVEEKRVELFSEFVLFPLNVSRDKVVKEGRALPIETITIQNSEELQQRFDDVFTPSVVALVRCIAPENMTYNPYKGFDAAYGAIWLSDVIFEDSGKRAFVLTSLSQNTRATQRWLEQHC